MTCRTGFVVAFSCKGRGVCPSCNGRHMTQTAAHLADRVLRDGACGFVSKNITEMLVKLGASAVARGFKTGILAVASTAARSALE